MLRPKSARSAVLEHVRVVQHDASPRGIILVPMPASTSKPAAIILLSGGMDSCVSTAEAVARHGREKIALLHAGYGQRTQSRERRAFTEIADHYSIPADRRLIVHLDHFRAIGGSALTDQSIAVPENQLHATSASTNVSEIPVTYVPFRNAHFLSVAVSWAEATGAHEIFIGAVAEDSSGYPDCRPEYYRAFQNVIREGTRPETQIDIVTPIIELKKNQIIRRGVELGAPLHLTWSCYQNDDVACGVCDSCLLRLKAFEEAGIPDPIPYRRATAVR
jgi:7-cyano-7-deazaguanine synthase